MNRILVRIAAVMLFAVVLCCVAVPKTVHASEEEEVVVEVGDDSVIHSKAFASAITIAVVAGLGALSMGLVIWKTIEGIARQPEAEGKIRTAMMLGLVFVETAIIYALIVAILIIFVL